MCARAWILVAVCLLAGCDDSPRSEDQPADADEGVEEAREPKVRAFESSGLDTAEHKAARERLVLRGVQRQGVKDEKVLAAMRRVPRHLFVPLTHRRYAYENRPLPIGWDQTISQPYIVGSMSEEAEVKHGEKVLEIGTGSGYQAAVLAELTPHVFSIEIKEPLAKRAAATLKTLGYHEIVTRQGDGYYGWKEKGPFDAIVVTAAAPHVPPPLVRQLKKGGRMVIPVDKPFASTSLMLVTKDREGNVRSESLYAVRFVPLTGSLGESKD